MFKDKEFHRKFGTERGYAPIAHNVILVDFDATLFPWGTDLMNWDDEPIPGAVEAMKAIKAAGHKVAIFTSRMSDRWLEHSGNDKDEQYEYVFSMCSKFGIPFDEIIGEKVPAIAYIDDRAIEFTGNNWPEIQERVLAL